MTPVVHMSVKEADQYIVNLMTQQKLNTTWYERPCVTSIEAINGSRKWSLTKKDEFGNFFSVMPRQLEPGEEDLLDGELPGAQLGYLRQSQFVGDVLEGLDGEKMVGLDSLTKDTVAFTFMERESEHLENTTGKKWRKTEGIAENEQIDLVVRWSMPQNGKTGFMTLFGVQLLREKKQITTSALKIKEAKQAQAMRNIPDGASNTSSKSSMYSVRRNTMADQKVMPIRVTFDYCQHVTHHFTEKSPNKQITLALGI